MGKAPNKNLANEVGSQEIRKRRSFIRRSIHDLSDDFDLVAGNEDAAADSTDSELRIATGESRAVRCLRIVLTIVLIAVTSAVVVGVYVYVGRDEQDDFELQFHDNAVKVISTFTSGAARRMRAFDSFAAEITSYALETQSVWPNVTLPGFERKAAYMLDLSDLICVTLLPFVTEATRAGWEAYSVESQGWTRESYEAFLELEIEPSAEVDEIAVQNLATLHVASGTLDIRDHLVKINGSTLAFDDTGGPYVPWWQYSPFFPYPDIVVNYNAFSHPARMVEISAVQQLQHTMVTKSFDFSNLTDPTSIGRAPVLNLYLNRRRAGGNAYEAGPVSDIYIPVFDSFHSNKTAVATLTAYLYWQIYFENVLPQGVLGVYVVLENTCGQQFTYRIDGPDAAYVGAGDLHDDDYDDMEVSSDYGIFLDSQRSNDQSVAESLNDGAPDGVCLYRLRVFPSRTMEKQYLTNSPLIIGSILTGIFVFTSYIFLLYDWLVERRQKIVMNTAVTSTQVVASLFPEAVRERVIEEEQHHHQSTHHSAHHSAHHSLHHPTQQPKAAIAERYENCTVYFADIAGFTSWSNGREPVQVFALLEELYGAFDQVANRRHVFKVETIGDCYMAVTGLPEPQANHAVIMTKFAHECRTLMNDVCHRLASTLGEDTTNLKLRTGLHSGPVTAGVLRGFKSRFQLFGDTVNTASRMESTGTPGKIHVSSSTMQLLVNAGKDHWLKAREDMVEAKGKGKMQTYWIDVKGDNDTASTFSSHSGADTTQNHRSLEGMSPPRLLDDLASEDHYEDEDEALDAHSWHSAKQ